MIKILAIDDNKDNLISLRAVLNNLFGEIKVLTALDGLSGIELAIDEDPDVILLDVVMPVMDGFEVCRRLKKDTRCKETPVVFITASKGDNINRIKALEMGAEGFLSKPIDEPELTAQIRAMVKIKRANEYRRDENARLNRLITERTDALEKELAERKKTQLLLQQSREDFRQIVESANDVFIRQDLKTLKLEYVSPMVFNILKYTPEECLNMDPAEMLKALHPDDFWITKSYKEDLIAADLLKEKQIERELRIKNKKGDYRWIKGNFTLTRDKEHQPYQIIGCLTDVTDKKKAEAKLRKTENHFKALIDKAPDGIALINANGEFVFISPSAKKMFGYSMEKNVTLSPTTLTHPADLPFVTQELGKLLADPSYIPTLQYRFIAQDGTWKWIESTFCNMLSNKDINAIIINFRDINERRIAEDLLKESEYFFKESQSAAFVGSYKFDLSADLWASSEILDQIFGIPSDYPRTLNGWLEIIHPEDREMMANYFKEEVLGKRTSFNKEYRIIRKSDEETRWVLGLGKLQIDHQGNILSMMGTIQDITNRVLAKIALQDNEAKYRELFEANADSIAIFLITDNIISNFVDCNENNARMLGYTKEEIFKLSPLQIEVPLTQDDINYRMSELRAKGQVEFETKLLHKSGTLIDVGIKAMLIRYNNQPAIMNISRDITRRKQQEISLQQSNELNQSLLKTIPFGMDIVDESGNILFMSDNFKKNFKQEVVGQKCWKLYRNIDIPCGECPMNTGIEIGQTQDIEVAGLMGDKIFQISQTGMMFQGKKAILEIFQDITEKKEVEKKLKLLAHSLENIVECVTITDTDDNFLYVNKSLIHTYGYTAEELIGKNAKILRSPDYHFSHEQEILPNTLEGGWKGEIINMKKDGTQFPIMLSTSVIKDEKERPVALVGVASDITEMRKSRAELIAAKEQAVESNNLKSAFLNNMSHEIRTPMNHIMGFSSLMAEAKGSEKDAYAEIILKSSNQLLTLIENVILLSRLQSEKIEVNLQTFEPAVILQYLADMFQENCKKKKIQMILSLSPSDKEISILSDHEKLKQILINLISNAIKYTQHGFIEIGFELQQSCINFFVRDSGLGIPKQEQEKIFETFYRSEEAIHRAIGGTGLGLSIVKELVKSLDGTIEMESEPGVGSTFIICVPVEIVQRNYLPIEPKSEHKELKDVAILVADDEDVNYLYLEILLKNQLKRLDYAANGVEAVNMVTDNEYDLILMDIKMPDMDGYEATIQIKALYPNLPVIAQTAYATVEDQQLAKKAGCDNFIAKPILRNNLMELILKYC